MYFRRGALCSLSLNVCGYDEHDPAIIHGLPYIVTNRNDIELMKQS